MRIVVCYLVDMRDANAINYSDNSVDMDLDGYSSSGCGPVDFKAWAL
jgi:hypothetical protein